jgi:ankyrin repeat protein
MLKKVMIGVVLISMSGMVARVEDIKPQKRLAENIDINYRDEDGNTLLHSVAYEGDLNLAQRLLDEFHMAVDVTNNRGETPLMTAAYSGQTGIMRLLLDHGADADALQEDGAAALFYAIEQGGVAAARLLVTEGHANINVRVRNGISPLFAAATNGHSMIVALLLANHAEVDIKERRGFTPLHGASHTGNVAIARMLITDGHANVNVKGYNGFTPLHIAAQRGHPEIVELLLEHGANSNALVGPKGETAFDLVVGQLNSLPDNSESADLRKRLQQVRSILQNEIYKQKRIHAFAQALVKATGDFIDKHKPTKEDQQSINKMLKDMVQFFENVINTSGTEAIKDSSDIIWKNVLQYLYQESERKTLYEAFKKHIDAFMNAFNKGLKAAAEPKKEPKRRDEDGGSGAIAKKKQIKISTKPVLEEVVTIEQQRTLKESGKKQALEHVIEHRTISV